MVTAWICNKCKINVQGNGNCHKCHCDRNGVTSWDFTLVMDAPLINPAFFNAYMEEHGKAFADIIRKQNAKTLDFWFGAKQ
jgi:hypothetical protein